MNWNYLRYKMCELRNKIRYIIALIKIRMIKFVAGADSIMIGLSVNIPEGKTGMSLSGNSCFIAENHFEVRDSDNLLELNKCK